MAIAFMIFMFVNPDSLLSFLVLIPDEH